MTTYPDELLDERTRGLREDVRAFVKAVPRNLLLDMDAERVRYPKGFLAEAGQRRLLGLRFPEAYGGRALPWTAELAALEEVGVLGTSLGCLYSLVSIVGEALVHFGTEEQKRRYLAPMIAGTLAPAEALTEPRGGSDFFGAATRAVRDGDAFILEGQKRFVVGAEGADVFLVYARTSDDGDSRRSITAFLVERGEGLTVEHVYGLMGTRGGGTGRLRFRNCRVPMAQVLGGEAGIGQGAEVFDQMMIPERMTSAGGALGMARAGLEIAARYAAKRKAFGQEIRRFEGVSFKIAESLTQLEAARALCRETGRAIDHGGVAPGRVRRMVSESKKFATDTAWTVVNHAMQVLGGIGYTNVYPLERLLRDIRLILIWTGTNEIMDLVIQHEFYREFLKSPLPGRNLEADAVNAEAPEEKVFE
ncbi:acyl-CoA dehydrogenase family protein [Geothrix mesophila]|uniref:acyl-CoA dehydrogenase family protein n=1 Tax=Geothrix mesophila TaxID=2922723 RepID=UPI001FAE1B79|nr:acyl-CoA dehydrogenase family protein [Geothrix sp. SG198]